MSVDLDNLDLDSITDERLRLGVIAVLNQYEELVATVTDQAAEIEPAEIYRLKGEHPPRPRSGGSAGTPERGAKPPSHSSERERREPRHGKKTSKQASLEVDRTEFLRVGRAGLPADTESKGFVRLVIQNLIVQRDSVEFFREKLYLPSTRETSYAPLPAGYQGAFGPGLTTLAWELGYGANVTFPKIHAFFRQHGIQISRGKVAALLTRDLDDLQQEAAAVRDAGLASSPWQQMDVTSTPVGKEWHACHLLSNPVYSAFRTTERQDRLSLLATLWGSRTPRFRLEEATLQRLEAQHVGPRVRKTLETLCRAQDWEEPALREALQRALPRLGQETLAEILEAAGIVAYQAATDGPVIRCLHADDGANLRELTRERSLCWIHDGRHYHKLLPKFTAFQHAVEQFQDRYWEFYRELRAYRQEPTLAWAQELAARFDALFATKVYYRPLATCIARTRANKEQLLLVLQHPELPRHNNEAELEARRRAIKRRVSHGPKTAAGARAWDTFHTLAGTAAKLGIPFVQFLVDRVNGIGAIPWLPDLIRTRAAELQLGASWGAT